jgi:sugar phosphate isomerase/epimerase
MTPLSRRRFLHVTGLSLLASRTASAIEPFQRTGPPRLPLSLAAYSFREFFKDQRGKQNPSGTLEMPGFIDFCAQHGCAGAELTSYFFPTNVSRDYLLQVRRHAWLRGVAISGTSVGNTFTHPAGPERDKEIALVKQWTDHAATLGTSHVRVFAGAAQKGIAPEQAVKNCIGALEECAAYAGERGVFLGIENHGGIVAEPAGLLEIIKAVKSPWVGINLDTGNFHTADPYADLAKCAPYAVNVQVKTEMKLPGTKAPTPADLPRLVKILRDANYQGWVALEYEAKPDPWQAVPPILAQLRALLGDAPAPKDKAAWMPLFDGKTLAGWKETNFSGQGEVKVVDGAMILDMGGDLTGVNYTGEAPRQNYEIALEAQRMEGSDFFCGLTFPVGEKSATLVVGGWGGGLVGVSSIDGSDASENETTQFMKFDKGRWYRLRVRVTPERLETWIDDEQMAKVDLAGKTIDMRAGEIELSAPFGIATYRTRGALRDIKLRRL